MDQNQTSHLSLTHRETPTDQSQRNLRRRLDAVKGWLCAHNLHVPDIDLADLIASAERTKRTQTREVKVSKSARAILQCHAAGAGGEGADKFRLQILSRLNYRA